eukprot:TRINITY_DN4741_c0_g1_i6.p1 TRINITY_DN4741_c0_g1~~TRINITY_DN4741_c0_g1_i6.p1  ORF type:complete len:134 (-),score=49.26 TRINITY_DN4741_c0_g1_i6:63-464(-)
MAQTMKMKCTFGAPAKILYGILTEQKDISHFTMGPSVMEVKEGGKFEYYNGKISGMNISFAPNKQIRQKWKMWDWKDLSDVELNFTDRDDECDIELIQSNIPENVELEGLEKGWNENIFGKIEKIIGIPIFKE